MEDAHHKHVHSIGVLVGTWVVLLLLTGMTVAVTKVDIGSPGNLYIAMIIATVKAVIVALIYMHLWSDRKMNMVVFIASVLFMVLVVSFTFLDVSEYQPSLIPVDPPLVAPSAH